MTVALSPCSARPLLPPLRFVVVTALAAGAVMSAVTEPVNVSVSDAASVAVTVNDFAPAVRELLAVSWALR